MVVGVVVMDAAAVEGHDDEVAGFSFFFFFLSSMETDEGSLNVCAGAGRGSSRWYWSW